MQQCRNFGSHLCHLAVCRCFIIERITCSDSSDKCTDHHTVAASSSSGCSATRGAMILQCSELEETSGEMTEKWMSETNPTKQKRYSSSISQTLELDVKMCTSKRDLAWLRSLLFLTLSFFSFFNSTVRSLPVAWWFNPLTQLNMGSRPFSSILSLSTGGRWRRRLSRANRDIFTEQAHATGCKMPAGRLCCPVSGICARTFSSWGGGSWSSQESLRVRQHHLRRIRWWEVRCSYHWKQQ